MLVGLLLGCSEQIEDEQQIAEEVAAQQCEKHYTNEEYAAAVKWCRQAAEEGDAVAQYNLGMMCLTGHGVNEDDAEAVKWYRKSAEQGYAVAQITLGLMYQIGISVDQDDTEVVKWYRKAAEQGDA